MKIKDDNLQIEVLENIKHDIYKNIHLLKIKVTALKKCDFIVGNIRSENGIIIKLGLEGIELLQDTNNLKKDDELEGYIAFQRNNIATLRPRLIYNNKFYKTDKKLKKIKNWSLLDG